MCVCAIETIQKRNNTNKHFPNNHKKTKEKKIIEQTLHRHFPLHAVFLLLCDVAWHGVAHMCITNYDTQ